MKLSKTVREDIAFVHKHTQLQKLEGKTILVTGATGLIGKMLIYSLLSWNELTSLPIQIIAVVRNYEKAQRLFGTNASLQLVVGDIQNTALPDKSVDYIVHAASNTTSSAFVEYPVEVIATALKGTEHLLQYAAERKVQKFVYLSTMEVYGAPTTDEKITETSPSYLDTLKVRSCYPESKRMCENLCVSYGAEYGVPFQILRLTQTFGPGVDPTDNRVFAQMARSVLSGEDIVLQTKGETKRSYLYTADAVSAILCCLLSEQVDRVYNVANEESYCSIYEMAQLVSQLNKNKPVKVRVLVGKVNDCYAPTHHMNLSCESIRALGWRAAYSLTDAFDRMMRDMATEQENA